MTCAAQLLRRAHASSGLYMTAGGITKPHKKTRASAMSMRRGKATRDMHDAVNALFDNYKDAEADKIGPESLYVLFEALELDPLDISALIFAWKLNAQTPCEFTRHEFVDGLVKLGVDSMPKLKKKVHTLKTMIQDPADFRSFYMYSFNYNKPQGQRSMPVETARPLCSLLLRDRFVHLDLWIEFLKGRKQAITRDSFALLHDFAIIVDDEFSNYEEDGAWPVILDEFVEYAKAQRSAAGASEGDQMSD